MKYLVTVLSLVAAARAVPITPGYGTPVAPVLPIAPIAPIEAINIPVAGPPIIEPVLRAFPFAPRALPFAARSIVTPRALPFAARPIAPRALPFAARPIVPRALPFAAGPNVGPRGLSFAPAAQPLTVARAFPFAPVAQPAPFTRALPAAHIAQPFPVARAFPAAPLGVPAPVAPIARAVPVGLPIPAALPALPSSQFQAQDEAGGFSFGYQNVNSAKEEFRTPDGVTRGAYSYVDANGIAQRVEYVADAVHGFRVIGTNIPVASSAPVMDTFEVAAAKAEFQRAFDAVLARNAAPILVDDVLVAAEPIVPVTATLQLRKKRSTTAGYGAPLAAVVPVPAVTPTVLVSRALPAPFAGPFAAPAPFAGPFAAPAPFATPAFTPALRTAFPQPLAAQLHSALPLAANVPLAAGPAVFAPGPVALPQAVISPIPSSQYHAQDDFGGVSFGYQNENSARQEVRSPDGSTQGSYSYVDGNGITQTVNYIADALGFRVTGTNLPVAIAA